MNDSYIIKFITPLFSRGAYETRAEIRPASIRGQLHWWFRALGGNYEQEKLIFGGVHNGPAASHLVVRVLLPRDRPQTVTIPTLPHKGGGKASPKAALPIGSSFTLLISDRLGGLKAHEGAFDRALKTWLLIGSLGLRATRGGGCFTYQESCLYDAVSYTTKIDTLLAGTPLKWALLPKTHPNADAARYIITDTLDSNAFTDQNCPLGRIKPSRKTSPLRLRVVQLKEGFRIAAVWDGRSQVTGNRQDDLQEAINILVRKNKPIGNELDQVRNRFL